MKPITNIVTLDHHLTRYKSMKNGRELLCEHYSPKGYFINLPKKVRTITLN